MSWLPQGDVTSRPVTLHLEGLFDSVEFLSQLSMNRLILAAIVGTAFAGCGGNNNAPSGKANLVDMAGVTFGTYEPDKVDVHAIMAGTNDGDGCAGHVVGTIDLLSSNGQVVQTMNISRVFPAIIAPGAFYNYDACCLTDPMAVEVIRMTVAAHSHVTYDTVSCP